METPRDPSIKRKVSRRGRAGEGRPSKKSQELVNLLADSFDGLTDLEACAIAGIHRDTLTEWRKDPEFSGSLKKAEALRLRRRIARIEAGEPGWESVCWILERTLPDRYGRREIGHRVAIACGQGTPEFKISVEQAASLQERSAALEAEAESLLNGRQAPSANGAAHNRLQGLL